MKEISKNSDVLVIGAGPAGSIAAAILKKSGLDVQVIEKTKFPRFVIGESLLPRCMEALDEAGLMDAVKAQHFQQKNGAKFVWEGKVCDFSFTQQYTKGYNHAYQVKRADFDKALADGCEEKGVAIHYETEVTDVVIHENGTSTSTVKRKDGTTETINAKFIVDGSGYGRVLPTLFGLNKPSTQYTRRAVFCHMQDPFRYEFEEPDRITIFVHNPKTWIWVIPFADGTTSVGYVGEPAFFEQYNGTITEQFLAMLQAEEIISQRFRDPQLVWEEPRLLQGWSATTESFYGKGFVLTGNVTEFLDPVFSSGVTLASVSSQIAAKLVIKQLNGEKVDWQRDYMDYMQMGVDVFRTYVNGWYDGTLFKIFFAENPDEQLMNQICSVLAGYVWDDTNPFVKNSDKSVQKLAKFLEFKAQPA